MQKVKDQQFHQTHKLVRSELFVTMTFMMYVLIILYNYRLALYVYEYLLHVGAQKAAQTFLSEVSLGSGSCDLKF